MEKIESYDKVIHITLDTSDITKKVKDTEMQFSKFEKKTKDGMKSAFFSKQEMEALSKSYEDMYEKEAKIAELEDTIAELKKLDTNLAKEKTKELEKQLKVLTKQDKRKDTANKVMKFAEDKLNDGVKKIFGAFFDGATTVSDAITNAFSDAWNELKTMASYSSSTYMYNRDMIDDALNYGFSSAQSYAYQKVKDMTGWDVDNLLTYGTSEQQRKFTELMTKYAEKYTDLEQSGFFDTLNDYQIEMMDLKEELTYNVAEFFVNNKDLVKDFLTNGLAFMEFVVKAIGNIVNVFGRDNGMTVTEKTAATSDIISNYTNANKTLTYNDYSSNTVGSGSELVNTKEQTLKALQSFLFS